ncbi:MAG: glucosidase [Acidobacteriota bacterium]
MSSDAEKMRLEDSTLQNADWKLWGSYVSERAWGTVREDYSADGSAWDYFPFEQSHLRAYRWNEDGIAGICDRKQRMCFAVAFWNGNDPVIKERLFGLAGPQGNHGEDVKEYYYYLDSTPTHSYMKYLYKYPHAAFPYEDLYRENKARDKTQPEYELIDTGIFDNDRYFDIFVEYAKADVEDICIRITAINRSSESAVLHLLPTVWFRNRWSWNGTDNKPGMKQVDTGAENLSAILLRQKDLGEYRLTCEGSSHLLFTENDSNTEKLFNVPNSSPFVKDGINQFVVHGEHEAVSPEGAGTKAAAHYDLDLGSHATEEVYLRLTFQKPDATDSVVSHDEFISGCRKIFDLRKKDADDFYAAIIPQNLSGDGKNIMRQSLAGMLWSKQFYHYVVKDWLEGDASSPNPPAQRKHGRNAEWKHLYNDDVVSMPDKWEYPWYAAWDLAFHCVSLALVDSDFAKDQLILLLREWYMHPNGQIPAYEWAFGDVNPPVHAWAALRVYRIEAKRRGVADRDFLKKIFHKLLLNFTWWVNRKDDEGNNVFEGGFLGLDNIGVFDRNSELPSGGHLEQSDGTSWMAMYSLNMLAIALELAREDKVYEDVASKFFEHFVYISDAMNNLGNDCTELWHERDGFYYDVLHLEGQQYPITLRTMVGLIPLFAVETVEADWMDSLPDFRRRTEWFLKNRPDLTDNIACLQHEGRNSRRLLALVGEDRLRRVLRFMLSENEFLSEHGIRSISRYYKANPFVFEAGDESYRVEYEPGESHTGMFGGNSNWRGPVWFPPNYLLIEALQKFDYFYGDHFKVEFPTGSGEMLTLWDVSQELAKRLCSIFMNDKDGRRPVFGRNSTFQNDPNWHDHLLFFEYFHGDDGTGLGAGHQTGWTGLVAKLLQQLGEYESFEDGTRRNVTVNTTVAELLKGLRKEDL